MAEKSGPASPLMDEESVAVRLRSIPIKIQRPAPSPSSCAWDDPERLTDNKPGKPRKRHAGPLLQNKTLGQQYHDIDAQLKCAPEFVSEPHAAALIWEAPAVLEHWREAGRGPAFTTDQDGAIRYSRDALLEWLKIYRLIVNAATHRVERLPKRLPSNIRKDDMMSIAVAAGLDEWNRTRKQDHISQRIHDALSRHSKRDGYSGHIDKEMRRQRMERPECDLGTDREENPKTLASKDEQATKKDLNSRRGISFHARELILARRVGWAHKKTTPEHARLAIIQTMPGHPLHAQYTASARDNRLRVSKLQKQETYTPYNIDQDDAKAVPSETPSFDSLSPARKDYVRRMCSPVEYQIVELALQELKIKEIAGTLSMTVVAVRWKVNKLTKRFLMNRATSYRGKRKAASTAKLPEYKDSEIQIAAEYGRTFTDWPSRYVTETRVNSLVGTLPAKYQTIARMYYFMGLGWGEAVHYSGLDLSDGDFRTGRERVAEQVRKRQPLDNGAETWPLARPERWKSVKLAAKSSVLFSRAFELASGLRRRDKVVNWVEIVDRLGIKNPKRETVFRKDGGESKPTLEKAFAEYKFKQPNRWETCYREDIVIVQDGLGFWTVRAGGQP